MHGLLNHLQNGAFEHVPRVVGTDGEFEAIAFIAGHTQEMVPSTASTTWLERAMGQITFYAAFDLKSSLRRLGNGDGVGRRSGRLHALQPRPAPLLKPLKDRGASYG
jgi:hypothetical protein